MHQRMGPEQRPRHPLQKPDDLVPANRMGAFVDQDVGQLRLVKGSQHVFRQDHQRPDQPDHDRPVQVGRRGQRRQLVGPQGRRTWLSSSAIAAPSSGWAARRSAAIRRSP